MVLKLYSSIQCHKYTIYTPLDFALRARKLILTLVRTGKTLIDLRKLIEHNNVNLTHLNRGGLHLSKSGTALLAENFCKYID